MSLIIGGEIINEKLEMIYRCKRNTPADSLTDTHTQTESHHTDRTVREILTYTVSLTGTYTYSHTQTETQTPTNTLTSAHYNYRHS